MTKLSTLARAASEKSPALLLFALMAFAAGCGSDPDPTPPPSAGNPPSAPAPIEGVATPSSVAVVTATNAQ